MSNLQIQLDPVALREATAQAIMGILTPEIKAQLIETAIRALLTPSTNSWERGKSPIEVAFNDAVIHVARELAKEIVKNDPAIMQRLADLARAASDKVLGQDADKLAEKMAGAFVDAMQRDR